MRNFVDSASLLLGNGESNDFRESTSPSLGKQNCICAAWWANRATLLLRVFSCWCRNALYRGNRWRSRKSSIQMVAQICDWLILRIAFLDIRCAL